MSFPLHPLDPGASGSPCAGQPSLWQQQHPSPGFPPLEGDMDVDVCIVGGGISGCSTAWHLAREGARVCLLEAREVAGGASGRNGGFLLAGLALRYAALRERFGPERARALYQLTADARDALLSTADDLGLGDFARRTGSLRLAIDAGEVADLEAEAGMLRTDGLDVEPLGAHELPAPLDRHFLGGLRFSADGASHPAGWVRGLATAAAAVGARLHEQVPVVAIESDGATGTTLVRTLAGHVVRAGTVVACCEAYLPGLLPELRGRVVPYRSQVLAAAPPVGTGRLLACPTWSRRGWDYAQQALDGHLVVGGEEHEDPALYATWEEATDPGDQAMLEAWLRRVLGIEPQVVARWAGVLAVSWDGLPLVGALPGRDGRVLVCGAWGGAGNVLGFAGGRMVAELLASRDEVPAEFRPERLGAAVP